MENPILFNVLFFVFLFTVSVLMLSLSMSTSEKSWRRFLPHRKIKKPKTENIQTPLSSNNVWVAMIDIGNRHKNRAQRTGALLYLSSELEAIRLGQLIEKKLQSEEKDFYPVKIYEFKWVTPYNTKQSQGVQQFPKLEYEELKEIKRRTNQFYAQGNPHHVYYRFPVDFNFERGPRFREDDAVPNQLNPNSQNFTNHLVSKLTQK